MILFNASQELSDIFISITVPHLEGIQNCDLLYAFSYHLKNFSQIKCVGTSSEDEEVMSSLYISQFSKSVVVSGDDFGGPKHPCIRYPSASLTTLHP